jgi:Zn-dependent metalloprotease
VVFRHRRVIVAGVLTVLVLVGVTSASIDPLKRGQNPANVAQPFVIPPTGTQAGAEPAPSVTTPPTATPPPTPAERQQAQSVAQLSPVASIKELQSAAAKPPALDVDANNHIRVVSAAADAPLRATPGAPQVSDPATAAAGFVNRYGQGFGLKPGEHAQVSHVFAVPGGDHVVRLQQTVGGVPVLGGDLTVSLNGQGEVVTATAATPAGAPATTTAAVSAERAGTVGLAAAAKQLGFAADQLVVSGATLWQYDPRMFHAPGRPQLRLTWWVKLGTAGTDDVATVLVDAVDATVVLVLSDEETAKQRVVCDLGSASGLNINNPSVVDCGNGVAGSPPVVRTEGQAPVVSPADVNQAYDNLGTVYDFYQSHFGRDSVDGKGLPLRATVRACQGSCPFNNAFWNGAQMVFGPGFAGALDVVGHELTHGVTQNISQLFYFGQSGGLNEALSDIMGELIDQSTGTDDDSQWLMGEDLPTGAIRSLKSPNLFNQPETVHGTFWDAAAGSTDDNGGVHTLSGPANKAAYLIAAGGSIGSTSVVGIGIDKSAQIWYRLQFVLPSGTNYADLASLLPAACRSILGVHSITNDDCNQVALATQATNMAADLGNGNLDANPCPQAGMPTRTFFREDFEHGYGNWTFVGPGWNALPSANIPVSWAHSGKHALIFDQDTFDQVTRRAFLTIPVPVQNAAQLSLGGLFVSWAENVTTNTGGGVVSANSNDGGGSGIIGSTQFTGGYVVRSTQVGNFSPNATAFSVSFAPLPISAGAPSEWIVDDIALYQCMSDTNGAPQYVAGQLSADRKSGTVVWGAPVYTAPSDAPAQYEVSVTPAVPGLGSSTIVPIGQTSLNLTGLDPNVRYSVAVRPIGGDGKPGASLSAFLPSDALFACPNTGTDANGDRTRVYCPGTQTP